MCNCLDPDQGRCSVIPDPGPKCKVIRLASLLLLLSADYQQTTEVVAKQGKRIQNKSDNSEFKRAGITKNVLGDRSSRGHWPALYPGI